MLQKIVVTDILEPTLVYSPRGRYLEMKDRETFGLSFCEKGQITYQHNGETFVSDPHHAIILPKGKSYTVSGDKTGNFQLINFEAQNLSLDTFLCIPVQNTKELVQDFALLQQLFFMENARAKVFSVFYDMLYKISLVETEKKDAFHSLSAFLRQNISDPTLCNQMMAEHIGVSEVYFRKLFRARYGIPPRQYILNLRIDMAKSMMRSGGKNVTEISEACGFSSVYHFCRSFKSRTAVTPGEYIAANRLVGI